MMGSNQQAAARRIGPNAITVPTASVKAASVLCRRRCGFGVERFNAAVFEFELRIVVPFGLKVCERVRPAAQVAGLKVGRGKVRAVVVAQDVVDSSVVLRRAGSAEGESQFAQAQLE